MSTNFSEGDEGYEEDRGYGIGETKVTGTSRTNKGQARDGGGLNLRDE